MVRGQRVGALTRAELISRLEKALPDMWKALGPSAGKKKLVQLLGHAMYHKLLTDAQVVETTPRAETTLPCYLNTYVTSPFHRQQLERYVIAVSLLYRRGTLIMNKLAQTVCGPRLPGASDASVSVLRPRFSYTDATAALPNMRQMMQMLQPPAGGTIEMNSLKHAFLPERWPSSATPRDPRVVAVLQADVNGVLPAAPPDWRAIMTVTGWDNAINRMMSKFCGNVKVHATAGLIESAKRYLASAPLHEDTSRWLLIDSVARRPRPIIAHNDDWHMAMELRRILAGVPDGCTEDWAYRRMVQFHLPERSSYSSDAMLLHLFLTRFGVIERSYLPVASRDRKYSYVDAKVARFCSSHPRM